MKKCEKFQTPVINDLISQLESSCLEVCDVFVWVTENKMHSKAPCQHLEIMSLIIEDISKYFMELNLSCKRQSLVCVIKKLHISENVKKEIIKGFFLKSRFEL